MKTILRKVGKRRARFKPEHIRLNVSAFGSEMIINVPVVYVGGDIVEQFFAYQI